MNGDLKSFCRRWWSALIVLIERNGRYLDEIHECITAPVCRLLNYKNRSFCKGFSRETVNRRLADLEKRGLVQTGRSEIHIPDWEALESEATSSF